MIILGKNTDDKGRQLEELTKCLLTQIGYEQIVANEVRAGGDEIDLTARLRQRGLKDEVFHDVICECKAYKTPLNLPDWLKFLGKLYAYEHGNQSVALGCFIALNGVNGNVWGHFKSLRKNKGHLQIVEGDDLIKLIKSEMQLSSIEEIIYQLSNLTSRTVINSDLAYYQKKCYWLVEFAKETFTVFDGGGKPIDSEEVQIIGKLIQDNTELREYVDLLAENEAIKRMQFIQKYVLSVLLITGQAISVRQILENENREAIESQIGKISLDEISVAIQSLLEEKLLDVKKGKYTLITHHTNGQINSTVAFIRYFLNDRILLFALGTKHYWDLIDPELLQVILTMQGEMSLDAETKAVCLKLIRWSPRALIWACHPDTFLLNQQKNNLQLDLQTAQVGNAYFLRKVMDLFLKDYDEDGLRKYFLKECGIVEVETEIKLRIKSIETLLAEPRNKQRIALGQMSEEYGDVIIPMLILPEQPEPWERQNIINRDEN
ncbi:restriction endonuclease [Mucilaginibacter ginkgonis]|uniref:Restriction endonuclease n=1 Tax=Mucilaginibacter ginkgonis TaxID=2682091 RepID=A0A6I4HUF2_9SPHI|nr:restriction endonuclease [Mucilaginibacter ginkgonis]QQL50278.1 restriction endonuclease [Mucilaginibacter ginkgonis]